MNEYNFKIVQFSEVPALLWDKWVSMVPEATYLHSSTFLSFLHEMVGRENAMSFACIQNDDHPLALCPLAVTKNNVLGIDFLDASWYGAPLGAPAFAGASLGVNRRLRSAIFDVFHAAMKERKAKRSFLRRHPVSIDSSIGNNSLESYVLYPVAKGYECQPQNTIVIDLRNSVEALETDLSRYQKKNMRRSAREGVKVVEYNSSSQGNTEIFKLYQQAHMRSAGKLTRPQKSFDLMLQFMNAGSASMFVAFAKDIPISFLYCGEFQKFAFGWSQVNLDEFEKQYSPRRILEWETMLSYKRRGFLYYELGTYWVGPQRYKIPTEKELSIAEFKRRYGGLLLSELVFERFFDRDIWERINEKRNQAFLESQYFNELLINNASMQTDD